MNPQAQAIVLLTVQLPGDEAIPPGLLSPLEWGRLAQWLHESGRTPESLFGNDLDTVLDGYTDQAATPERVRSLLARGTSLALAAERWERAGLWVITRADGDYPTRLRERLHSSRPPVLFGVGNRLLLEEGGVAIVGTSKAAPEDLTFAARLGMAAAVAGRNVVSGGTQGIEEAALQAALGAEGTAVAILASDLLRTSTSRRYRDALLGGALALVSPFQPEARFDSGLAAQRSRCVYGLADLVIVVASGEEKSGTWNGAAEIVRAGWVSLHVLKSPDAGSGNSALVAMGAWELGRDDVSVSALLPALSVGKAESPQQVTAPPKRDEPAPEPNEPTGKAEAKPLPAEPEQGSLFE